MIQSPLHLRHVALAPVQLLHSINLSERVNPNILGQPERLSSPFHVPPDRLPRPMMLDRVPAPWEHPDLAGVRPELLQQLIRQIHAPALPGLLLRYPKLPGQLLSSQRHHITDPKASRHTNPAD